VVPVSVVPAIDPNVAAPDTPSVPVTVAFAVNDATPVETVNVPLTDELPVIVAPPAVTVRLVEAVNVVALIANVPPVNWPRVM
jgi:hypothetical protein